MSVNQQEVITAAEVQAVQAERVSLLATFAQRYGLEANNMMRTLRSTVFRPNKEGREPSNEQVAAFLIVAHHHNLSPFTKEIHGFLDKWGGIVAVVGVDGWAKKINEHPAFDGMTFEQDDEKCTCTMHRKDRSHPVVVTEYLLECKRGTDPWISHPKRMLRHKAMIQCARLAFSFAGIYEPDEAEGIVAAVDALDVTPGNESIPAGKKVGPKKLREVVEALRAAIGLKDARVLYSVYSDFDSEQQLYIWGTLQSWERSAIKVMLDSPAYKAAASGLDLPAWSIQALTSCANPDALQTAWATIQEAFAENDLEVPGDIETVYIDRKKELGV